MNCSVCNCLIPEKRTSALPGVDTCIRHAAVTRPRLTDSVMAIGGELDDSTRAVEQGWPGSPAFVPLDAVEAPRAR